MVKKEVLRGKKRRIELLLSPSLLRKLDTRKKFPAWENNRNKLITAAIEEFLN
jgi:hypothetical protein